MSDRRSVMIGGYSHGLRAGVAGRFGCGACFFCGVEPGAGDAVWSTSYGDVVCSECSVRYQGK